MEKKIFWITAFAVGSLVSLLYMSVTVLHVTDNVVGLSDWVAHSNIANGMMNGAAPPPHFLYQLLVIGLHYVFGVDVLQLSPLAAVVIVFVTFVIAYGFLSSIDDRRVPPWLALTATCFLLLSHPVALLFPYDSHLYFGYIASNVYHNPSILVLKPIALMHFVLLCLYLGGDDKSPRTLTRLALLMLLTVMSIAAKPNYIIALLPALFVLLLIRYFYNRVGLANILLVTVIGVFVPAVAFLLWQFNYFYMEGNNNAIRLGVFEVYGYLSDLWTLLPKLLLSLAFPLSVFSVLRQDILKKTDFQLAVLMLLFSLLYTYFLVDTVAGQGAGSGNFWWSSQISNFILCFVCIRSYVSFMLERNQVTPSASGTMSIYLPVYVGILHFAFGLVWLAGNLYPVFRSP